VSCVPCYSTHPLPPPHATSGGLSTLKIFHRLLSLAVENAADNAECDVDDTVCADPAVRVAASFLSQLLCYTAVVPACDPQLALLWASSSDLPPLAPSALANAVVQDDCCRSRWRLWKLQRDAVVLLLKCLRSTVGAHVSSTSTFAIAGALQVHARHFLFNTS
jgi:hypothetical protein